MNSIPIVTALKAHRSEMASVVPFDLTRGKVVVFDFTASNRELAHLDINDVSERRSIHLGIDLFVVEGTEITSPLPATVHSAADNAGLGNYGPTVILRHHLDGIEFHTLYGHLSRTSLNHLEPGQVIAAGDPVAEVGDLQENGSWPPHLHFQIITEPLHDEVDYPGVAAPSERERFLQLCPDPNLILGIPGL
jgi:murein DD-endopeptidase MepM/ murein hydrolase activator NlpD